MYLYLEGAVHDVDTIRYATKEGMEARGVEVYPSTEIFSIDPEAHSVEVRYLPTGEVRTESYDKLIISPGSVPFVPEIKNSGLENIVGFGGRDSAVDLRYKTVNPDIHEVVVIGGGYIGIEAATSFAANGKHVTVFDPGERPLAVYLDPELGEIVQNHMKEYGIDFIAQGIVKEFIGDTAVEGVRTDTADYPADLVIVAAGVRPNTEWLRGILELDDRGFIETDHYMQTSRPDIFAVGNATKIRYNPTDTAINISLATNARKQGRYAVKNLSGPVAEFKGVQGTSALPVFEYHIASTGLNGRAAERSNLPYDSVYLEEAQLIDYAPDEWKETVHLKMYFDRETRRVLGGQILSKADMTEMMNTLSLAIMNRMTVDDLAYADFFFQPDYNHPWSLLNQAGLAAQRKLR